MSMSTSLRGRQQTWRTLWIGGGALTLSVLGTWAYGQVPALPVDPARPVQDTLQPARDAARDTTNQIRDAAKDVGNTARDAARDTRSTIQDTTKGARDAARDAARDVRDTTLDAAKDVRDTARDAARDVRDTTRNALQPGQVDASGRVGANLSTDGSVQVRGADMGLWFDRSVTNGLVIADIAANAAFGRFGFREGDRIVSIAGQPVATEADFVRYFSDPNARDRMDVIVLRNGQQQTLYVEPLALREQMSTAVSIDPFEQFGVVLDDRYTDRLVVWRVIPRSPAFYAGIRAGDILSMFGGRRVANSQGLIQVFQQTNPGVVPIQVTRNGRVRMLQADFPAIQVANRRTTYRQNLDVDSNVRSGVNANADAQLRTDGNLSPDAQLRTDVDANLRAAPAAPAYRSYNYNNYSQPRRGLFRRWR